MLAHATAEELAQLDKRIVVVVWIYGGYAMPDDAAAIITRLRDAGLQTWGASSVRCWDDDGAQNYPLLHRRVRNIRAWVTLAEAHQLPAIINTNWSTPFGLGSPYGLFETSRYPAFLAAEQCWNPDAPLATFLQRFVVQYHEVAQEIVAQAAPSAEVTDYFEFIPTLLDGVRRNRITAALVDLMRRYDYSAKRHLPMQTYLVSAGATAGGRGCGDLLAQPLSRAIWRTRCAAHGDVRLPCAADGAADGGGLYCLALLPARSL